MTITSLNVVVVHQPRNTKSDVRRPPPLTDAGNVRAAGAVDHSDAVEMPARQPPRGSGFAFQGLLKLPITTSSSSVPSGFGADHFQQDPGTCRLVHRFRSPAKADKLTLMKDVIRAPAFASHDSN
jgi:hypothetical protein